MKIGIVGYGVMGKLVEKVSKERGHEISAIVDPSSEVATHKSLAVINNADEVDVWVDFSSPEAALGNISDAMRLKTPIIMATTGWYENMSEVADLVKSSGVALVWGSNFSVGVNMFWRMVEQASQLMASQKEYDVFTHEFHHKRKKDSPSGTAITTAEKILSNYPSKTKIVTECLTRAIEDNELHVSSTRGGDVPGTHQVYFDSPFDTIQISHTARTREGFALGSVMAAEWAKDKSGLHAFHEIFNQII